MWYFCATWVPVDHNRHTKWDCAHLFVRRNNQQEGENQNWVLYKHKACLHRSVQTDVGSSAGHVSLGIELQESGLITSGSEPPPIWSTDHGRCVYLSGLIHAGMPKLTSRLSKYPWNRKELFQLGPKINICWANKHKVFEVERDKRTVETKIRLWWNRLFKQDPFIRKPWQVSSPGSDSKNEEEHEI